MMRVLMIAIENGRWGPARLPQSLTEAGFEVAVMCPPDNPIAYSSFVKKTFEVIELKSWRKFGRMLQRAMNDWKPDLIMPCDEPIVAMLHHLIRKGSNVLSPLDRNNLKVLIGSIGTTDHLNSMLFKYNTRKTAESLGIDVPRSAFVTSAEDAVTQANFFGYPIYLKKSFSWAGQGVIDCANDQEVDAAYHKLDDSQPQWRKFARKLLGRDWYPIETPIEVQSTARGVSVMYNVVAWHGKMLGGFLGSREQEVGKNGPSTIVKLSSNSACEASVRKMVAALGATGLYSFDFMWCKEAEKAYLLECNPRPNQVNHLGKSIGIDICGLLAAAMAGEQAIENLDCITETFPLFPQEWFRSEESALNVLQSLDVPQKDSGLLNFLLAEGKKRGRNVELLHAGLKQKLEAI